MEKQNNTVEPYLSLYDYLGHAAGPELGKAVSQASILHGIKPVITQVENPKYTGKILMYPKSFLDAYFNKTLPPVISIQL